MTEQKTKRRGWVKNAVIIFLAVMLVLTFFSNTFMNRSLPEVATQYTSSGPINAMIRGTGTATANETYEVKIDQTRTVLSTHVRVGDPVEAGDLLFKLQDAASDELETLQDQLDELEYNYQVALLDASANNGSNSSREIQRAREDLEAAQAEFALMTDVSLETITTTKNRVAELKAQVSILKAELDAAQNALDALGGLNPGSSSSSAGQALNRAQTALNEAKTNYDAVYLRYGGMYEVLGQIAQKLYDNQTPNKTYTKEAFMQALAENFGATDTTPPKVPGTEAVFKETDGKPGFITFPIEGETDWEKSVLAEAYKQVTTAKDAWTSAQQAYNDAVNAYNESNKAGNTVQYNKLKKKRDEAQADYDKVNTDLEHVNTLLADYETQRSEYSTAKQNVRTLSNALEDLLAQQQQEGVNQSKEALALERQREQVAELREKVEKMEAGGEQTEVLAQVSGVVRTITASSGNKVEAGSALATIEVTDMGYSLTMPVSEEQAKKVRVGDSAQVGNYKWGSDITATLTAIRNDPEKPGQGKLLLFALTGDLESGATLNISIGQRSQNYDVIVPNSAIREDSNGTFVYVVEARSSPLGNRYFATRVDVTVQAKDDNNSAVSGSLSGWNASVITTSTKPITAGMQVRLAEN